MSTQAEERRRIQRALSEGAERRLVAVGSLFEEAAREAQRESAPLAVGAVRGLLQESETALLNLQGLARGVYPPALEELGLAAALRVQAESAPLSVDVRAAGLVRYPIDVEAAVYFCALEAMQNATKYADATSLGVVLSDSGGDLRFEVVDDGRGFDTDAAVHGSGLQGIIDRLAAVGGSVAVRSAPGQGTSVTGSVPLVARSSAAPSGIAP